MKAFRLFMSMLTCWSAVAAFGQDSLLAHYPFGGNSNDHSGNGHHATFIGATLVTDRFGNDESTYEFDGVDDFINLPSNFVDSAFTISLWVNTAHGGKLSNGNAGVLVQTGNINANSNSLSIYLSDGKVHFAKFPSASGWEVISPDTINDGQWHSIVAQWDGTLNTDKVQLWVDGSEVATGTSIGTGITHDFGGLRMGMGNDGSSQMYYPGLIDDVHIFDQALESDEIDELFHRNNYADFDADYIDQKILTPLEVDFEDLSQLNNPILEWAWDIDNDGVTDYTTQNPSHTYTQQGTYTVKLTVTDTIISETIVKESYIQVGDLGDSLVAYYPFSGSVEDSSSNANDGIIHDLTLAEDRFANVHSAYDFNGTSSYLAIDHISALAFPGSFSISLWIAAQINDSDEVILISKGDLGNNDHWMMSLTTDSLVEFNLFDATGTQYTVTSSSEIESGKNYHLIAQLDTLLDELRLYVNNQLVGSQSIGALPASNTDSLLIGAARNGAMSGFYKGVIDEVRIYNRAINETEIENLYKETLFADFSHDNIHKIIAPTSVDFEDISIADSTITSWEWDFDEDGIADATDQNPTYVFENDGVFDVSLTISDGYNKTTIVKESLFEVLPKREITEIEYFYNEDPGIGQGTIIDVEDSSTLIFNGSFAIEDLPSGFNQLYVRAKDNLDLWGQVQTFPFLAAKGTARAGIKAVEYFFDTDPGIGNGNEVAIDDPDSSIVIADLSTLDIGYHTLYVRSVDSAGNWGHTQSSPFLVAKGSDNPGVKGVEYFIDNDPGLGDGNFIYIDNPEDDSFVADLSNLETGFHTIHIRALDSAGNWGHLQSSPFLVVNTTVSPNLVAIEYFFDEDPGYGNGTSIALADSSYDEVESIIDIDDLTVGAHTIFIRGLDEKNQWGQLYYQEFNTCIEQEIDHEASICAGEEYAVGDSLYSVTGEYITILESSLGCDSTVNLTLTVFETYSDSVSIDICSGETYSFGEQTLSASGDYEALFTNTNGCDSTVYLTLNVKDLVDTTVISTLCKGDSTFFSNRYISETGSYIDSLETIYGCDSVVTLDLEILDTYSENLSTSICSNDSLLFGSSYLSAGGEYQHVFEASNGCDSVINLTLLINEVKQADLNRTICEGESYEIEGDSHTSSGSYSYTLSSSDGCDSVVNLTLTVLDKIDTNISRTICNGETIVFGSNTLDESGSYAAIFDSQLGCDSLVNLSLKVKDDIAPSSADISFCSGDTLEFGKQLIMESGEYTDTLVSIDGCDSIVTITVTEKSSFNENITVSICVGETYSFGGTELFTGGFYTHTYVAENHCDSIISLTLNIDSLNTLVNIENDMLIGTEQGDYQWINCSTNAIATETSSSFKPAASGEFKAIVTRDGCIDTTDCVVFTKPPLGFDASKLVIFPNPVGKQLNIHLGSKQSGDLQIIDLLGRTVLERKMNNEDQLSIDLTLKTGTYVLILETVDGSIRQHKIVIKND
ncbi:MAG: PKD domain-containing protein [Cyclobacteriaceae bacterium]